MGFRRQMYYERHKRADRGQADDELAGLLHQATQRFVAWGFWKVFHYVRNIGHPANHKRVYRIWKREGLHLRLPPKRGRLYRKYQQLLSPEKVNEGWAMDFVSDWVVGEGQKQVRIINIMDEGSRRALWTEAHNSISAKKLIQILDHTVAYRGKPAYIRCDNGPEFISQKLEMWAEKEHIELKFIQPGKPSQNGLVERLNKTLRIECLNLCWFTSMEELNEEIQSWSHVYNHLRPHENLGNSTPEQYENKKEVLYYSVAS